MVDYYALELGVKVTRFDASRELEVVQSDLARYLTLELPMLMNMHNA